MLNVRGVNGVVDQFKLASAELGFKTVWFRQCFYFCHQTSDPALLWAGNMTGTAPMRSSVAWLTAYECVCCCPWVAVGIVATVGRRLKEPLLRVMTGGEGAELVVTTRVLGGGRVWVPLE